MIYEINTTFQHVYGHQYRITSRDLTMEEKLNVQADKLVRRYQEEHGSYQPITHMYPSSPTVLEINGYNWHI